MIYKLPPKYKHCTLENFDFSKINLNPNDFQCPHYEFLTIIGGAGVGKTHLAIAIAKKMPSMIKKTYYGDVKRDPEILFLPMLDFYSTINYYTSENSRLEYIRELLNYDMIILDDLGAERQTEASRQNLYYLIEKFYSYMKPMIITSNLTIQEINEIDPRIASRLAEFKILKIKANDYRLTKKENPK